MPQMQRCVIAQAVEALTAAHDSDNGLSGTPSRPLGLPLMSHTVTFQLSSVKRPPAA